MTKMGNVTKQYGIMQVNTLKSLEKLYAYWKIKKKIHIIKTNKIKRATEIKYKQPAVRQVKSSPIYKLCCEELLSTEKAIVVVITIRLRDTKKCEKFCF